MRVYVITPVMERDCVLCELRNEAEEITDDLTSRPLRDQ
jgi:hypothetical protein